MQLRAYCPADCPVLAQLFYETVHTVNARDYTQVQLNAWADGRVDLEEWNRSFLEHTTVVAQVSGCIAGFGDMTCTGYLDRLYVHWLLRRCWMVKTRSSLTGCERDRVLRKHCGRVPGLL